MSDDATRQAEINRLAEIADRAKALHERAEAEECAAWQEYKAARDAFLDYLHHKKDETPRPLPIWLLNHGGGLYSAGYASIPTADELGQVAVALDAVVVDIRMRAWSRRPGWSGMELVRYIGPGYYTHIPQFGNVNYKGGPIQLRNPAAGLKLFGSHVGRERRAAILLCGCADYERCHRKTVVELLQGRGR